MNSGCNVEELDFPEVKDGMILYDRDDGKLGIVIDKGNLKDLTKYDLDNIIEKAIMDDSDNANGNAVAYCLESNETAVALYGEYGTAFCLKEK